eukprot:1137485-Pelagomonas_calceolata.AAC.2
MSCCAYLGKGAALEDLKGSLVGVAAVMAQHTVIGAWLQQMLCHAGAQRRNTDTHTNVIAADVLSWWHTEEHTDVRADVDNDVPVLLFPPSSPNPDALFASTQGSNDVPVLLSPLAARNCACWTVTRA